MDRHTPLLTNDAGGRTIQNVDSRLKTQQKSVTLQEETLSSAQLEQLERDLCTALYGIWKALGKQKRIVKLRDLER